MKIAEYYDRLVTVSGKCHTCGMGHELYEGTADCFDLPELLPEASDGVLLQLPTVEIEEIVKAVGKRQKLGGVIQEKVDGCWCCMTVDTDARLVDARSRANLPLRFAAMWEDQCVDSRFIGWRIVGELEAGTTRALNRRGERGEALGEVLPIYHVYSLVDPSGQTYEGQKLAMLLFQLIPVQLHGRMRMVQQALPGEDWEAFARRVFDQGGEGVVIRQAGVCYRAKPQVDFDRVVLDVVTEKDTSGKRSRWRHKAILGLCISNGRRPRYKKLQTVMLPAGVRKNDFKRKVVSIVGSSVDLLTGVVRHARIVELREDKQPWECKAA